MCTAWLITCTTWQKQTFTGGKRRYKIDAEKEDIFAAITFCVRAINFLELSAADFIQGELKTVLARLHDYRENSEAFLLANVCCFTV